MTHAHDNPAEAGRAGAGSARLFVGLPLPESYQQGLAGLIRTLAPLVPGTCSWTKPGNWHLTLAFLGDVPLNIVPDLCAALASVRWEAFPFMAGGGGFFPSPECPRVFWVGAAEGGRPCRELAWAVKDALASFGLGQDARPFAAHLTLARIRSSRPGADWKRPLGEVQGANWPQVVMDRFVLWRSYLGGALGEGTPEGPAENVRAGQPGPRYLPLGEFGASG
ncbi:RNA 2',3'-cyclic phosphodiesterase [Fundidesulfovibrio putealis]|uniref:RNA 2',3'-cyclic phosphodiesterase n=1 Tax=Fundidesulfovibrio putealis TaxID=270496 RepID=UPI000423183D|nr:RNA 2',3'-cyclic phosphodiesterase [Fundidesulfovibrio putealis]